MREMRPYINYRFKCNIWGYEGNFVPAGSYFEYTVKKVKLPAFKIDTENKISFGNTAYVIPIINFADTSLDITFEEDENMSVFEMLCGFYGNNLFNSAKMKLICIKIDQFDETMMNRVDSKLYLCRLKEFSQPNFNNNGRGVPVEITASFNVVYIYQGDAKESGFKYEKDAITRPDDEDIKYFTDEMKAQSKKAEELYKKKEEEQKQRMLKYLQSDYEKYKENALQNMKKEQLAKAQEKHKAASDALNILAKEALNMLDKSNNKKFEAAKNEMKNKKISDPFKNGKTSLEIVASMEEIDLSDGIDSSEKKALMEIFGNFTDGSQEALEKLSKVIDIYSDEQLKINTLTDAEDSNLENALKTVIEQNGGDFNDELLRAEINIDNTTNSSTEHTKIDYGSNKGKTRDWVEEDFETDNAVKKLQMTYGENSPRANRETVEKVRTENKKEMEKAFTKLQKYLNEKGITVEINAFDDANHAAGEQALNVNGSHVLSSKIDLAFKDENGRITRGQIGDKYLDILNEAARVNGFVVNWEGYDGNNNIWGDWALANSWTIDSNGKAVKNNNQTWTQNDQIAIVNNNKVVRKEKLK